MARTQDEIVARIEAIKGPADPLGFRFEALAQYLDAEHVRPWLRPDAEPGEWKGEDGSDEGLRADLAKYVAFGWGKVEDHRGISAGRTLQKVGEWLWLLGLEDLAARMDAAPYAQYGAPGLALVCRELGLPVPESLEVARMIEGMPCVPHCDMGCG